MDRSQAAEILWALPMVTLVGLGIYRLKLGSFPRHLLRYSVLLGLLLVDAIIGETISKLVRVISF